VRTPRLLSVAPRRLSVAPWRLALAPWRLALAPWRLALAPWRLALAPWRLALAPWRLALAPWRLAVTPWRLALVGALVSVALMASAQQASANVGETIILRCTNGQSIAGFSQSAYREALKELEADLEEYSPQCGAMIREAQRTAAASSHRGGSAGAGQSTAAPVAIAATPAQQRAITHAQSAKPESVKFGGAVIHPGVVHVGIASALSSLPTPLLATLAFLLACLLAVVGVTLRNRVRANRSR
jgi:hypothetical protein